MRFQESVAAAKIISSREIHPSVSKRLLGFRIALCAHPTQKPILLLERIIALVTSPGDLVLDPFCGSGTTLLAAELIGRNSLGIDVAAEAAQLAM